MSMQRSPIVHTDDERFEGAQMRNDDTFQLFTDSLNDSLWELDSFESLNIPTGESLITAVFSDPSSAKQRNYTQIRPSEDQLPPNEYAAEALSLGGIDNAEEMISNASWNVSPQCKMPSMTDGSSSSASFLIVRLSILFNP